MEAPWEQNSCLLLTVPSAEEDMAPSCHTVNIEWMNEALLPPPEAFSASRKVHRPRQCSPAVCLRQRLRGSFLILKSWIIIRTTRVVESMQWDNTFLYNIMPLPSSHAINGSYDFPERYPLTARPLTLPPHLLRPSLFAPYLLLPLTNHLHSLILSRPESRDRF